MTIPKWLREGKGHFPCLYQIFNHLGLEDLSSKESEESSSDSEFITGTIEEDETVVIGVDHSMGREYELFGTGTNNVTVLEKGISPPKLGKKTITLFLE